MILERRPLQAALFSSGIIRPLDWRGRVVWLSAHAWKACNPQRFAGSNPALSALSLSSREAFLSKGGLHSGDDIRILPSPLKEKNPGFSKSQGSAFKEVGLLRKIRQVRLFLRAGIFAIGG